MIEPSAIELANLPDATQANMTDLEHCEIETLYVCDNAGRACDGKTCRFAKPHTIVEARKGATA